MSTDTPITHNVTIEGRALIVEVWTPKDWRLFTADKRFVGKFGGIQAIRRYVKFAGDHLEPAPTPAPIPANAPLLLPAPSVAGLLPAPPNLLHRVRRDMWAAMAIALRTDVIQHYAPADDRVLYVTPEGQATYQAPARRALETFFVIERRHRNARKATVAHIRVSQGITRGNLARSMGDPLCQPAHKFNGFLDIIPDGVIVCPRCAELAQRYNLPIPNNAEVAIPVSARRPRPDDPPTTYEPGSKWFGYNWGIPFDGHLRRWAWIRQHCKCATCEARVQAYQRGETPVEGLKTLYNYFVCDAGHDIRDERDLVWRARANSPDADREPSARIVTLSDAFSTPF